MLLVKLVLPVVVVAVVVVVIVRGTEMKLVQVGNGSLKTVRDKEMRWWIIILHDHHHYGDGGVNHTDGDENEGDGNEVGLSGSGGS